MFTVSVPFSASFRFAVHRFAVYHFAVHHFAVHCFALYRSLFCRSVLPYMYLYIVLQLSIIDREKTIAGELELLKG